MKRPLLCLFILVSTNFAFGQSSFKKNILYGQFAGNGIFLSINYERQLTQKPGLGIRVGIGHASSDEKFRITIPVGVYYLLDLKNNKSFIDMSLGATWSETAVVDKGFSSVEASGHIVSFVPGLTYRHQTKGGFMWRIGFTPIINKYRFIPFPELSIGMSF